MFEHQRLSPERLYVLQIGWVALMSKFGIAPAEAYPLYDRLLAAYAEPHRHYHNLEHIAEMLKIVGKLGSRSPDLPVVQLAVWFHDAVCNPLAKDNEERSAELAEKELRPLGIPEVRIARIRALILATKHAGSEPADADADLFLDADLAILGAEELRYRRYAAAIRKEYAQIGDDDYSRGRIAVLEGFLARPAIYRTQAMQIEGEEAARWNMKWEIDRLTAKLA